MMQPFADDSDHYDDADTFDKNDDPATTATTAIAENHFRNSFTGDRKRVIRMKFICALFYIKNTYRREGSTILLASYSEYLRVRDSRLRQAAAANNAADADVDANTKKKDGGYEIHLESNYPKWKSDVAIFKKALRQLPSSESWHAIEWIGSTAIPKLVAKPVIDLMITLPESINVKEATALVAREASDPQWIHDTEEYTNGFQVPIGFLGEFNGQDWGFLQFPAYAAEMANLTECNLHFFHRSDSNATSKIIMRNYLLSSDGVTLKNEYASVKKNLEVDFREGRLSAKDYNKGKNGVIQDIMRESHQWQLDKDKGIVENVDCCSGGGCGSWLKKKL